MATYATQYRKVKVGAIVKLRVQLETRGGVMLAEGLQMRVTRKRGGLHLQTINNEPCPTCGVGEIRRVHGVSLSDVIVIQNGGERK